ncbi:unnamed protein product [Amoebophrya sp. A120]|nr:unnamed protein product [Amoebophrya sp. A120]|eukprot:GSA120T00001575001.1
MQFLVSATKDAVFCGLFAGVTIAPKKMRSISLQTFCLGASLTALAEDATMSNVLNAEFEFADEGNTKVNDAAVCEAMKTPLLGIFNKMIEPDLSSSEELDAMDCALSAQRIKRAGGDTNNDGNLSRAEKEIFCGSVALSGGERISGGVTGSFLEFTWQDLWNNCRRSTGCCDAHEETFGTTVQRTYWGTIGYGMPQGEYHRSVVSYGTVVFKTGFGDVFTVEFTNDVGRPGDILVNKQDIVSHALSLKTAARMDRARGHGLWADKLTMWAFAELRGKLQLVASLGVTRPWMVLYGVDFNKVESNISKADNLVNEMNLSIAHFPDWVKNEVNNFDTNPHPSSN